MMAMVVMARTLFNTLIIPVLIIAAGRFTVQSTVLSTPYVLPSHANKTPRHEI